MNKSRRVTAGVVTAVLALTIGVALDMGVAHSGGHALHGCIRKNNQMRGYAYTKLDAEPNCYKTDRIVNWDVSVKPPATTVPKTTTTNHI